MTDASELDEAAARARCDAATEGPWESWPRVTAVRTGSSGGRAGFEFRADTAANAEFIAHARTDLPAALDENARLRAALDEAKTNREFDRAYMLGLRDRAEQAEARAEAAEKERDEARANAEHWARAWERANDMATE
ncbi:hypothetical protein RB608_11870 [Nocardioides sp. LHD-245]|uniref:hypothetical protein n=1 Tax=Nocardioides sp. LHD-245 TaxID=3051387 RepID=UPI0027E0A3DD|nr:hypothetical protein [Nocardioides sp. LHD-245]